MKHFYILTLLSGLLLTNTLNAATTVRFVKTNGTQATGSNAANATSWATACADLQAVINASAADDEIWIAAGIYRPTHSAANWTPAAPTGVNVDPNDRDNAFVLKTGVRLYGGFNGTETALADRNPKLHITILSGDLDNDDTFDPDDGISTGNRENNAHHVVIGADIPATTVLDGVTVTGGNADDTAYTYIRVNGQNVSRNNGGGMHNRYSSPTLTGVIIA
jgi:hypothetical protein